MRELLRTLLFDTTDKWFFAFVVLGVLVAIGLAVWPV